MRIPLTLALLIVATPVHAQGYVGGYTVDSATSEPLPCVEVALVDTTGRVVTRQLSASDGMFQLDAPPRGVYRLRFSVWYHEPLMGPGEELEPTMERARKYALAFQPGQPETTKRPRGPTAADVPPGPPRDLRSTPLRYPDGLRIRGLDGEVVVHFLVDSTGRVVPATLDVMRSTHPEFTAEVRKFLRSVEFEPARLDRQPVCALIRDMPFNFNRGRVPRAFQ